MKQVFAASTGLTPLGEIWLAATEAGLLAVEFPSGWEQFSAQLQKQRGVQVVLAPEKLSDEIAQLTEYAAGLLTHFSIRIDWSVLTPFQIKILKLTAEIPYGETRTYKELAMLVGNPRAARAVGRAQATNPMPIVIPCHRVVGTDGKLHGYGAGDGLSTKQNLLKMEKALIA